VLAERRTRDAATRRCNHHGRRSHALRRTRPLGGDDRRRVADSHGYLHAPLDVLDRDPLYPLPLGIGEPVGLAEDTQDEDAGEPRSHVVVDDGTQRRLVERFIRGERRDSDAVDAGGQAHASDVADRSGINSVESPKAGRDPAPMPISPV
jgi:hypothetical protein